MKEVTYPTWRYHATKEARIVDSPEKDKALGSGWADVPFESNESEDLPPEESPENESDESKETPRKRAKRGEQV